MASNGNEQSKLSPTESFKVKILLEEALNKLYFLISMGSNTTSIHKEELTRFMGDEISRSIKDQKELQLRYEALVMLRDELLTKLDDRDRLHETQAILDDITIGLAESNKSLCRNLEANPDIPANLIKMEKERELAHSWINDLYIELKDSFTFLDLRHKVDTEKKALNYLTEVRAREQAVSIDVLRLEDELKREYEEEEVEGKEMNAEIRKLKEELSRSRNVANIEL
ncbi:conserved hypothetical protein, partial [Perkinsus marinus ATCC 50983]